MFVARARCEIKLRTGVLQKSDGPQPETLGGAHETDTESSNAGGESVAEGCAEAEEASGFREV